MPTDHDMEAEAQRMLSEMRSRQYQEHRAVLYFGDKAPIPLDILESDLLALLRELAAAREAITKHDEELDELHEQWTSAVVGLVENVTIRCDPAETTEETINSIVGQVRDALAPPPAATEGRR